MPCFQYLCSHAHSRIFYLSHFTFFFFIPCSSMASDLELKAKEAFEDDNHDLPYDLLTQAIGLSPNNADLYADRAQVNNLTVICSFTLKELKLVFFWYPFACFACIINFHFETKTVFNWVMSSVNRNLAKLRNFDKFLTKMEILLCGCLCGSMVWRLIVLAFFSPEAVADANKAIKLNPSHSKSIFAERWVWCH